MARYILASALNITMRNPTVLLGATWLTIVSVTEGNFKGTLGNFDTQLNFANRWFDQINHWMFQNAIKPTFPLAQESLYNAYSRLPPAALMRKPGEMPTKLPLKFKLNIFHREKKISLHFQILQKKCHKARIVNYVVFL